MSPESLSINVTEECLRILEIINSFYPQHAKHDLKILVNDDANESMTEHRKQLAYNHGPP